MTYEDLLLLPEDGLRHEIIDGEHYVNASPVTKHQRVSMRLIAEFNFYLREHPVGELFHAPLDIVFSRYDVVEPDLLFISNDRRQIITEKNIQGAPDLLIEIVADSTRHHDEVKKYALYEREGASEYWLIDADRDCVRVLRPNSAGHYVAAAELSGSDKLSSPLFPTLDVSLESIFAE